MDDESGNIVGHIVLTHRKPSEPKPVMKSDDEQEKTPEVPAGMNPEVLAAVMKFVQETDTVKDVEHYGEFFKGNTVCI